MTDKKYCPRCRQDRELTEDKKCKNCGLTLQELREIVGDKIEPED